jgi:hypothetical protein
VSERAANESDDHLPLNRATPTSKRGRRANKNGVRRGCAGPPKRTSWAWAQRERDGRRTEASGTDPARAARHYARMVIAGALGLACVWRERTLSARQRQLEVPVGERTRALEAALATRYVFPRALADDLKAPIVRLAWYVNGLLDRPASGCPRVVTRAASPPRHHSAV